MVGTSANLGPMRVSVLVTALTVLPASLLVPAVGIAGQGGGSSRVVVSTTLNDTLVFLDATELTELQPPFPSKGGGPVRLWVQEFDGSPFLFAANHGVAMGSVGVFDLSGDIVTELPLSPFPARPGSVGIAAGEMGAEGTPMVFITNTWFALGGCDLPNGSVTAYDASMLSSAGILVETGTVDVAGAIPYAVSVAPEHGIAFASTNCADTLETVAVDGAPAITDARATGAGPDGTIWDAARSLNYTVNIGGDSLSVHDLDSPEAVTTVPLPDAGPIELNLAGDAWAVTANGADDSISVIDRDVIAACVASAMLECPDAEALRVPTGVPGGAPEGIDYDPVTGRVFVVNKPIGGPSLTVIELTEDPELSGSVVATIPLGALGLTAAEIPAFIAFDVAVQTP